MNSTVLALLLLSGLNALPDRPVPSPQETASVRASSPFQATDQATRLAAKGRLPQWHLQLRMDQRLAVAANGHDFEKDAQNFESHARCPHPQPLPPRWRGAL
jgi:hypothetical protein